MESKKDKSPKVRKKAASALLIWANHNVEVFTCYAYSDSFVFLTRPLCCRSNKFTLPLKFPFNSYGKRWGCKGNATETLTVL